MEAAGGRESTAAATLRIVERANSGRSLCLSHEADGCQHQKTLPAGTTVLSENPLVNLAIDGDCCDRCMATGLIGQAAVSRRRYRCQACGLNHCSERCRKRHGADECAAFVAIDGVVGRQHPRNNWLRLVARTCLCVQTCKLLSSFCHHAEDRRKAADDAALLSKLLAKCCGNHAVCANSSVRQPYGQQGEDKEPAMVDTSEQLIVKCWCVLRCNLLTIHDDAERCGERHLGWGLYHLGSLFNHSCAPNVEWHHRGAQLVVNCLVDLVPGAELSISYVDLASDSFWTQDDVDEGLWPREGITSGQQYMSRAAMLWSEKAAVAGTRRREKLFRDYHFRCDCCRCTDEINVQQRPQGATEYGDLNQFWREFQNRVHVNWHLMTSSNSKDIFCILAAPMADVATCSASGHEAGDQMQDGLAPLVTLLYEQGGQIPCADLGSHDRHWADYLLQVACRIQELRRIHPPNGAFPVALHYIYYTCMFNNQALLQSRLVVVHMHCSVGNCVLPGQACDEPTHEAALEISGESARGSFATRSCGKGHPQFSVL